MDIINLKKTGLWQHFWRPISFALVVEYFGIGYVGRDRTDHLMSALKCIINFTTDWGGKL